MKFVANGDRQARTVGVYEGNGAALVIRTSDVVEDDSAILRPSRLTGALLRGTVVGDLGELAPSDRTVNRCDGWSMTWSEPTSLVQKTIRSLVG
jgi:hypothetical protein